MMQEKELEVEEIRKVEKEDKINGKKEWMWGEKRERNGRRK